MGCGLWLVVVVDCGRGGGGAKLWVLIVVVEKKNLLSSMTISYLGLAFSKSK